MDDAKPEELAAIQILWRQGHGEDETPSTEEQAALLAQVRERAAAIEQESLAMLRQSLRQPTSMGSLRHRSVHWFFTRVLVPIAALALMMELLARLWRR